MNVTESAPTEQRNSPRYDSNFDAEVSLLNGPSVARDLGTLQVKIRNISRGGLYMEIQESRSFPQDAVLAFAVFKSVLDINIRPQKARPGVRLTGRTVWVQTREAGQPFSRGVAVTFQDLDEDTQEDLSYLISSLAS